MKRMYRRKQQNGKVVIVDYDDTILPSTFVDRWKIEKSTDLPQHVSILLNERTFWLFVCSFSESFADFPFPPSPFIVGIQFQNMLEELSTCTERFLEEASKYGEVSHTIVICWYWCGLMVPTIRPCQKGFQRRVDSGGNFSIIYEPNRHVLSWLIRLWESNYCG